LPTAGKDFQLLHGAPCRNMRFLVLCGGVISLASLLILAVGIATNHWINFHKSTNLNPDIVNDQIQVASGSKVKSDLTTNITYTVRHYGLWVGCYMERVNRTMSCAYIGSHCYTNVCWIRRAGLQKQQTCKDTRMKPLTKCAGFQFVRVLLCLAVLFMLIGTSAQLVCVVTLNRSLAAMSGIIVFVSGFLVMVGFSVFYSEEFSKNHIHTIASIGYSLILVAIAWPLMFLSGIISCCFAGADNDEKDDYSSSNF
jgi:hypothetical protein